LSYNTDIQKIYFLIYLIWLLYRCVSLAREINVTRIYNGGEVAPTGDRDAQHTEKCYY
jgi:hypothetical protein